MSGPRQYDETVPPRRTYGDVYACAEKAAEALKAVGIHASVHEEGGGLIYLDTPLSEDHTRWVWFGWHLIPQGEETGLYAPLCAHTVPMVGDTIEMCAYWDKGVDDPGGWEVILYRYVPDRRIEVGFVDTVREMLTEALALGEEGWELI